MLTRLLHLLHRHPVVSTGTLLVVGLVLVFVNMVFLSRKISADMAVQYARNYVGSLGRVHALYSSEVVARVSDAVTVTHDYRERENAIPFPATFSIELAKRITESEAGVHTRLYSDFPFTFRQDGGPRDPFERLALTTFRFADDPGEPFVRFEDLGGVPSLRYAESIVMAASCIDCHNTHPDSPKKDWKVGDVRGARAVTFPLDATARTANRGLAVTAAFMLAMTLAGLGLIFLVVQALRTAIDTLSETNTAYNRFVPHEFLSYLKRQSIVDVRLNDNIEAKMTVLFCDIRSFTALSEQMTPEENFTFINDYLRVMGPVVRRNRGFIDKYIGDAIMALFDDADDAVRAAVDMQAVLMDFNRRRWERGEAEIEIGVGIHKGKLRLGTIGEHDRMDSTVISDVVNLAARIEGLTKFFGVRCLISGNTYRALREPEDFHIRFVDKVRVKGKHAAVDIYEVFNGDPPALLEQKLAHRTAFEDAVRLYAVREFARAKEAFARLMEEMPDDRICASYLQRCDRYQKEAVAEDWDGAFEMEVK